MTERLGQSVLHHDSAKEQAGVPAVKRAVSPIAVAIVNYNTREHLRACLASIASERCEAAVVVDNASSDGSAEMVQANYPWVRLIINQVNCGYGAAANQAIANCTSRYVLLLNSDTLLEPGVLPALSVYLDRHPQAAIVGPRLVYPDGSLQVSCFPFPTPLYSLLQTTSLGSLIGSIPTMREYYLPAWSHTHARVVPWVLGAALAIRRDAFEAVNGFDESFFMYSEEVDLCYRLGAAGWQVHFTPVTTIVHTGGASTVQYQAEMEVQRYAGTRQFYRRHYSRWQGLQRNVIVAYSMLRNIIRDTIRLHRAQRASKCVKITEDIGVWKRVLLGQWRMMDE